LIDGATAVSETNKYNVEQKEHSGMELAGHLESSNHIRFIIYKNALEQKSSDGSNGDFEKVSHVFVYVI
jgi:hypothetical protein